MATKEGLVASLPTNLETKIDAGLILGKTMKAAREGESILGVQFFTFEGGSGEIAMDIVLGGEPQVGLYESIGAFQDSSEESRLFPYATLYGALDHEPAFLIEEEATYHSSKEFTK